MTDLIKDWLDDWLLTLLPPEIMSVNIDSGGVHGTEVDINARKRAEAKQAITDKLREARKQGYDAGLSQGHEDFRHQGEVNDLELDKPLATSDTANPPSGAKSAAEILIKLENNVAHYMGMISAGQPQRVKAPKQTHTAALKQLHYEVIEGLPKKKHSARVVRQMMDKLPQNTSTVNANLTNVALGYNQALSDVTKFIGEYFKESKDD